MSDPWRPKALRTVTPRGAMSPAQYNTIQHNARLHCAIMYYTRLD